MRLLIDFVSYSTRSFAGCITGIVMCFAALLIGQWVVGETVGAVSALPPVAIIALLLLAVGVVLLPSPWRAVVVVATVIAVLAVPVVPAVLLSFVLPAAWLGRQFGAHIRPRTRGARFATVWTLFVEGFLGHRWFVGGVWGPFVIRLPIVGEVAWPGLLADRGWPLGGLTGGFTVRLADRDKEGVLAVAPPGSGKTSGPAVGAILSEADRPEDDLRSLVVGDPKDELARITLATLARTHRPLVWDPSNPADCTAGFDPLATLPDPSNDSFLEEVQELADSWFWATRRGEQTTDPFFITQPRSLMRAAMLTFVHRYPGGSFVALADWLRGLTFDELLACVEHSLAPAVRAFAGAMRMLQMNDRAVGGIFADVQQRFDLLDGSHIRAAMDPRRNPPIDWGEFVMTPTILYIKVAARDSERLGPLLSLFLARMYRALTAIAARDPGNVLPRGVRVIIDEFGNLSRIYGVENALATLRSYGIGHYLFVQTTAQIRHHYGRDLAQTIQDNLVTKVILGGAAQDDAKAFSDRLGERTQYHPTVNHTAAGLFRGSASFGHSPERAPLVSAAEIMHMRNTVLVSTRGLPPVRCKLRPYYQDRRTVARLKADAQQLYLAGPGPATVSPSPSPTTPVPSPVTPAPWSLPDWDDI